MNCNIDQSPNVLIGGFAFTRDMVDWATEVIKKLFRRINHDPNWELRLRLDERQARDVLLGLRSSSMASMALEHSFSCLRDEFPAGGAVRFRVFVTGQPKALKPAIQEQIYLIGREALINAFRHSEATSIEAEVEYLPRRLRIRVRDNCRGIDPKTIQTCQPAHWGLLGMRERAAGIGAQLQVWSRLGCGTEVEISIPARRSVLQ